MPKPTWTHAQEIELIDLINMKISANEAAKKVGRSRNSVIGKSHRLGLSFLYKPKKRTGAKPGNRNANGGIFKIHELVEPIAPPKQPEFLGLTLFEMNDGFNQCRFIDDKLYCGQPSEGSWCSYHRKIVYHSISERSRTF